MHHSDIELHLCEGMEIREDFVSGRAFTIMSDSQNGVSKHATTLYLLL